VILCAKGEWPVGEVYGVALLLFKHRMDLESRLNGITHLIELYLFEEIENGSSTRFKQRLHASFYLAFSWLLLAD
jgi:hypothetical protein